MKPVTIKVCDDNATTVLTMKDSSIELAASEVEELIEELMKARAQLHEPVRQSLDTNAKLLGVIDPSWTVSDDPGNVKLLIRHPGFGWIAFLLSRSSATALYEKLRNRVSKNDI